VSKPLHLSSYPEILVKIAPLVSELRWLESRPLKKILKKTSVKYIALPASLPSGLKNDKKWHPISGFCKKQGAKNIKENTRSI